MRPYSISGNISRLESKLDTLIAASHFEEASIFITFQGASSQFLNAISESVIN